MNREALWTRIAGESGWGVAWTLLAASILPWLLPESWSGNVPWIVLLLGWMAAIGSFWLLGVKVVRYVGLGIIVIWAVFLGLSRLAKWDAKLPTGYQEVTGVICEPWQKRGFRLNSALSVASPPEMRGMSMPISVSATGQAPPEPGTPVRFRAELRSTQPGPPFMAERPLWRARNDGRLRQVALSSSLIMEQLGPPRPGVWLRFRCWMFERFQSLPIDSAPARDVWGALALGIFPINDEVSSSFSESGVLHLLVVSGLQITLIMATAEAFFRRILKRGGSLGAIMCGLAFAALVGFSAPIWRGLLMGVAWVFGRAQGWRIPPALSLHLALLFWMATHPASGCAPGFLIGWWAMLGLVWIVEPLQGLVSPLLGKGSIWLARVAAPWATTMPLLAIMNGGIPAYGIITNLAVLPFVWILLPLCLALTILPIPAIIAPTVMALDFLAMRLVPLFAKIVPMATGILWPWLALAAGWLLLAHFRAAMMKSRALAACLMATTLCLAMTNGTGRRVRDLTLEVPDVGQGDALLIRVPRADATLIDAGPTPWSARRVARVLSRRGVREPVHLLITHPHADHAGGWPTLARLWPFDSLTVPVVALPDKAWRGLAPKGSIQGAFQARRGDSWQRGDAHFSVHWPPKPLNLPDPNMVSAVLRLRWRSHEIWFMGDALAIQERDMIDLGDPGLWHGTRLLKAGHHGGATATGQEWIGVLHPSVVLFTSEYPNRFDFPREEVLNRCQEAGAGIVITGPYRGVTMEALGEYWMVSPYALPQAAQRR
ncbi:MAG: ComEC/Rec2 family competence protein [Holophagales bacterium]|nr:ComEC/Rec2 family competence protein [Holophagales bacterium]